MRRAIGYFPAAILATLLIATPLAAQDLQGVVRDSTSRQPVPGAVVTLLDVSGGTIGRGITNERGEYRALTTNGATKLRIVRLGFRPRDILLPISTTPGLRLDISLVAIAIHLEPVRITAAANCPSSPTASAALALLEQARAGLLATVVARSSSPATMKLLRFRRMMAGKSDSIVGQLVQIEEGAQATMSFGAVRSGSDFARDGFMKDSSGIQTLYGPDAEALLDDGFASAYCFRLLAAEPTRANQIGLGFQVAKRRSNRVDIDGAIWIDTVAKALRNIEFDYVGIDRRFDEFHPGGRVWFREMPNGVVLIDRWHLRMVYATADTFRLRRASGGEEFRVSTQYNAQEAGGELARATWPDGRTWQAPLGTVSIHADSRAQRSAANTVLRLEGTDYRGKTDASGNLTITDVLPGPYFIRLADARAAASATNASSVKRFAVVRDSTTELNIDVVTVNEFARVRGIAWDSLNARPLKGALVSITGRPDGFTTDSTGAFAFDSISPGTYTLSAFHQAMDSIGLSGASRRIEVRQDRDSVRLAIPSFGTLWKAACGKKPVPRDSGFVFGMVRDATRREPLQGAIIDVSWQQAGSDSTTVQRRLVEEIRTDEAGAYSACGIPPNAPLRLAATNGATATGLIDLPASMQRVQRRDLVVGEATDSMHTQRGTILGVVRDETRQPIPGARVSVIGAREARTGDDGRFLLSGVPVGTRQVQVLSLGRTPLTTAIDVFPIDTALVSFELQRMTTLEAVNVTANTVRQRRVSEIQERMTLSPASHFMDSTMVSGFAQVKSALSYMPIPSGCVFYVDAIRIRSTDAKREIQLLDPGAIAMIEVHRAERVPIRFQPDTCVVLIWTKMALP
ncbi:MAG: carboxypeptidase regulatory-like domain-containing protein [Gemmatimonadota bacterium]